MTVQKPETPIQITPTPIEALAMEIGFNRINTNMTRLIGQPPAPRSDRMWRLFVAAWNSPEPKWDGLRSECRGMAAADPTLREVESDV